MNLSDWPIWLWIVLGLCTGPWVFFIWGLCALLDLLFWVGGSMFRQGKNLFFREAIT